MTGHPLAVPQRLGADRVAGDGVEHADEVGRHDPRLAVEPPHRELVLEREREGVAAEVVEAFDRRGAAEEALGGPPRDVVDLAGEDPDPGFDLEHRVDRIAVGPPRGLHGPADRHGLGGGAEDRALLHFFARPRGLARGGDGADLHARLAADPLHPLPARRARHHHRVVADVGQGQRVHLQIVDGEARHLRLGERAPHAIGVDDRQVHQGGGHEGLDGVAAADLERHHGAELPAEVLLHHLDGERHRLGIREALLADERGAHVGDDGHEIVVRQLGGIHERHTTPPR
jgi:hypothetical protein